MPACKTPPAAAQIITHLIFRNAFKHPQFCNTFTYKNLTHIITSFLINCNISEAIILYLSAVFFYNYIIFYIKLKIILIDIRRNVLYICL